MYKKNWLLCVVAKYADLDKEPRLATGIYNALKRACVACKNSDDVIRACLKHFPEEFLGINEEKLRNVVQQTPKHKFDIELGLTTLQDKLSTWTGANAWGAGALNRLLRERKIWPGLPPEVP